MANAGSPDDAQAADQAPKGGPGASDEAVAQADGFNSSYHESVLQRFIVPIERSIGSSLWDLYPAPGETRSVHLIALCMWDDNFRGESRAWDNFPTVETQSRANMAAA
jgi:hypothetical protein